MKVDFIRLFDGVGKSVSDKMIDYSANKSLNKNSNTKSYNSSSSTVCGDKSKMTVSLNFK